MLSRVANTLYWMARYIERADNLARLVDVNRHFLLDHETLDSERIAGFRRPIILCTGATTPWPRGSRASSSNERPCERACPPAPGDHDSRPRMKLTVVHRTAFHYGGPVTDSANALHLEPHVFPFQKTISSLIRVLPATRLTRLQDLFQNITHHFEIHAPHDRLEIESRIRVHTLPLDIPNASRTATKEAYLAPEVREKTWHYLNPSARVTFRPES